MTDKEVQATNAEQKSGPAGLAVDKPAENEVFRVLRGFQPFATAEESLQGNVIAVLKKHMLTSVSALKESRPEDLKRVADELPSAVVSFLANNGLWGKHLDPSGQGRHLGQGGGRSGSRGPNQGATDDRTEAFITVKMGKLLPNKIKELIVAASPVHFSLRSSASATPLLTSNAFPLQGRTTSLRAVFSAMFRRACLKFQTTAPRTASTPDQDAAIPSSPLHEGTATLQPKEGTSASASSPPTSSSHSTSAIFPPDHFSGTSSSIRLFSPLICVWAGPGLGKSRFLDEMRSLLSLKSVARLDDLLNSDKDFRNPAGDEAKYSLSDFKQRLSDTVPLVISYNGMAPPSPVDTCETSIAYRILYAHFVQGNVPQWGPFLEWVSASPIVDVTIDQALNAVRSDSGRRNVILLIDETKLAWPSDRGGTEYLHRVGSLLDQYDWLDIVFTSLESSIFAAAAQTDSRRAFNWVPLHPLDAACAENLFPSTNQFPVHAALVAMCGGVPRLLEQLSLIPLKDWTFTTACEQLKQQFVLHRSHFLSYLTDVPELLFRALREEPVRYDASPAYPPRFQRSELTYELLLAAGVITASDPQLTVFTVSLSPIALLCAIDAVLATPTAPLVIARVCSHIKSMFSLLASALSKGGDAFEEYHARAEVVHRIVLAALDPATTSYTLQGFYKLPDNYDYATPSVYTTLCVCPSIEAVLFPRVAVGHFPPGGTSTVIPREVAQLPARILGGHAMFQTSERNEAFDHFMLQNVNDERYWLLYEYSMRGQSSQSAKTPLMNPQRILSKATAMETVFERPFIGPLAPLEPFRKQDNIFKIFVCLGRLGPSVRLMIQEGYYTPNRQKSDAPHRASRVGAQSKSKVADPTSEQVKWTAPSDVQSATPPKRKKIDPSALPPHRNCLVLDKSALVRFYGSALGAGLHYSLHWSHGNKIDHSGR